MKSEAQRIAIAEASGTLACPGCGWKQLECWSHDHKAPDYLNDLNAMHEAVASLSEDQQHAYAVILAGMPWKPEQTRGWQDYRDTLAVSEATAAQRAEAFLKCLGLWKATPVPRARFRLQVTPNQKYDTKQ